LIDHLGTVLNSTEGASVGLDVQSRVVNFSIGRKPDHRCEESRIGVKEVRLGEEEWERGNSGEVLQTVGPVLIVLPGLLGVLSDVL
jgi:hypothetical protein